MFHDHYIFQVTYIPEFDPDVKSNGTKLARIIRGPPLKDAVPLNNLTRNTWTENNEEFIKMFKVWGSLSAEEKNFKKDEKMKKRKNKALKIDVRDVLL